jgi:hypothetical protein
MSLLPRFFQKSQVREFMHQPVTVGAQQMAFIGFRQHPVPGVVTYSALIQANFFECRVAVVKVENARRVGLVAAFAAAAFQGNQPGLANLPSPTAGLVSGFRPSFVRHGILL